MKKIVLLVDETRDQGELEVCSFYTFDNGLTYTFRMDDEWRIHTAIYASKYDVQVKEPIWHHMMDPRDYSQYGDYTPDFIMEVLQGSSSFCGYDIPSKIVRNMLLAYDSSTDEYIRTSTIEHCLTCRMNELIRQAIKEYKEEEENESKSNQ